jgi:cytoskeleton protein RodZ
MKSVGTKLREGRERLGWTLKAAAKSTKIREDQLQKLEADDFAKFHAPTYIRGFVRNYASILGLNVREVMEDLDRVMDIEVENHFHRLGGINYVPELTKTRREFSPRSISLAIGALLIVVILMVVGMEFYRVASAENLFASDADKVAGAKSTTDNTPTKNGEGETVKKAESASGDTAGGTILANDSPRIAKAEPVGTPPPATTVPAAPATPEAVPSSPTTPAVSENKLALMAKEECWVRVSVLENNQPRTIFEDILPAGQSREFPPAVKYLVKVSIPAAVDISLNGKSYATTHTDERLPIEFSVPAGETN